MRADVNVLKSPTRVRTIRAGEGRAVAILAELRNAGGRMSQRKFEETCLRHCRTLVGAGGFIARGSIKREVATSGEIIYILTDKGEETVTKWEARYGSSWVDSLEFGNILGSPDVHDQQKISLMA